MHKMLFGLINAFIVAVGVARAEPMDNKPSPEERIARNYYLARKMYDAYANISKIGYPDSWQANDFEPGWTWEGWSPDSKNERRARVFSNKALSFEEWNREEYKRVLAAIPDLHVVTPFVAICNVEGCSFQLNAGGHDRCGTYREFNESIYMWTTETGKIRKLEVYDDWANMIDFMEFMTGKPISEYSSSDYLSASLPDCPQQTGKKVDAEQPSDSSR